ncbi:hypothetical protein OIU74_026152 [Salix koriyanagi]|uniref:Uncharacterized protein n=1 Tax=Salix koriyanagi TaxID=2511006 RepID=A0A9Q0W5K4_9ROSI|nr:hypothetical protein OIU74_026152 [Salix koriyanagi]
MVKTTVARGKEVTTTIGIQHEPAVKKNTKGQGPVVREKGVMEVPVKQKEQEGNGEKQPKRGTSSQMEKPVRCTDNEMACLKSQSSIADEESKTKVSKDNIVYVENGLNMENWQFLSNEDDRAVLGFNSGIGAIEVT